MDGDRLVAWRNPWLRWSVLGLAGLVVVTLLVGFVWLPTASADFSTAGAWASICRAAGVPTHWGGDGAVDLDGVTSTDVVLDRAMAAPGADAAVGRGATLALGCTTCHGAQGVSSSDAPDLGGQYRDVVAKQLMDFRAGRRANPIMQGLARNLSDADIADLAAYYGYLPRPHPAATALVDAAPTIVRSGAPLRNVAPCGSCHGDDADGRGRKLGAPWLTGLAPTYLVAQLKHFRAGERHNDSHAQMRNMAHALTDDEIAATAAFYARAAAP